MTAFALLTHWRVAATIDEVAAILADPLHFPDWWPEVYLGVRELAPGAADGTGRTVAVVTRGRLPYTLRWQGRVVESRRPHGWTVEATGDLTGRNTDGSPAQGAAEESRGELHRDLAARGAWQLVGDELDQGEHREHVGREPVAKEGKPRPVQVEPTQGRGPTDDDRGREGAQARDDTDEQRQNINGHR